MNKFYVYALLDERKPGDYSYEIDDIVIDLSYEPFYIGKGTGNRMVIHEKLALIESNTTIKDNKIRKIWSEGKKVIKTKILDQLDENTSLELEIKLIKEIKRKEEGGPLINLTDGGDGLKNPSLEVRQKISESSKNRIITEETREKLRKNWFSKLSRLERIRISRGISLEEAQIINDEISNKIGSYIKGSKHSNETKQKISSSMKGIPKPIRTEQHKKNLSISLKGKRSGFNNPMFDKNFRDFRIKKHGESKEKLLENERRNKINITTLEKKDKASKMFPGVPYNVYMQAYALYNNGMNKEEALRIAEENNLKNNIISKENKIKLDVSKFYKKLNDDTLNPYKKELYDTSLFLLELRKNKGIRDFKDELKDINAYLGKKYRNDKIKELQQMIDFYGIKIEESN
jgi:hypothetical protein